MVMLSDSRGHADTQFYWELTPHIFRYNHYYARKGPADGRIHAVDEGMQWNERGSIFIAHVCLELCSVRSAGIGWDGAVLRWVDFERRRIGGPIKAVTGEAYHIDTLDPKGTVDTQL